MAQVVHRSENSCDSWSHHEPRKVRVLPPFNEDRSTRSNDTARFLADGLWLLTAHALFDHTFSIWHSASRFRLRNVCIRLKKKSSAICHDRLHWVRGRSRIIVAEQGSFQDNCLVWEARCETKRAWSHAHAIPRDEFPSLAEEVYPVEFSGVEIQISH